MPNLEIEKLKPRREICGLPGRPHEVANITVLMRGLGQSSDWLPPIHKVTTERGFEHRSGEEVGGKSEQHYGLVLTWETACGQCLKWRVNLLFGSQNTEGSRRSSSMDTLDFIVLRGTCMTPFRPYSSLKGQTGIFTHFRGKDTGAA